MSESIVHSILWYSIIQVIGWIAWLACVPELRSLPDRGHGLSKPLGIMLSGTLAWGFAHTVPGHGALGSWLAVGVLAGAATYAFRSLRPAGRQTDPGPLPRATILLNEAIFACFFFGWCIVKTGFPAVEHTEQPMDLAMLTAIDAQSTLPVGDPWFAGEPVRYYTFGWFLVSHLGKLAGTSPEFAYNLGLAAWLALLASATFGVGCALSCREDPVDARAPDHAVGLLATVAATLVGTMVYTGEWLSAMWSGQEVDRGHWWWFRTARAFHDEALDGTAIEMITETPVFGFLLGDLHPHLLALPLIVVVAGLAVARLRQVSAPGPGAPRGAILLGIACAAAVMTNAWSAPLVIALAVVVWARQTIQTRGVVRDVARTWLPWALSFALPVAWAFAAGTPDRRGLRPNVFGPTEGQDWIVSWGALLPGVLLAAAACLTGLLTHATTPPRRTTGPTRALARTVAATAALLGLCGLLGLSLAFWATGHGASGQWIAERQDELDTGSTLVGTLAARWLAHGGWPLLLLLVLATASVALWPRGRWANSRSVVPPALLLAATAGSLLLPEFVFLGDVFGHRMNTVFKFHHQAWPLGALTAAWGMTWAARRAMHAPTFRGRLGLRASCALGLMLMAASMATLPESIVARWERESTRRGTLSAWVAVPRGEQAAARWLASETDSDVVLAGAPGRSYQWASSRLCTLSGRACLLGWEGHLWQWHGDRARAEIAERSRDLERLYRPLPDDRLPADDGGDTSPRDAVQRAQRRSQFEVLRRRGIDYVVLGPLERERFGLNEEDEQALVDLLGVAFESGAATERIRILGPVPDAPAEPGERETARPAAPDA